MVKQNKTKTRHNPLNPLLSQKKNNFDPLEFKIKYPDTIPLELLLEGDADISIKGYVYPYENRKRGGIYYQDELVGFFTPRHDLTGWRVGAIYIKDEFRGVGMGTLTIQTFLKRRKASPVPIDVDNFASQRAFEKAGFVKETTTHTNYNDGVFSDYNWWYKH